jgi:hypothetical protein
MYIKKDVIYLGTERDLRKMGIRSVHGGRRDDLTGARRSREDIHEPPFIRSAQVSF